MRDLPVPAVRGAVHENAVLARLPRRVRGEAAVVRHQAGVSGVPRGSAAGAAAAGGGGGAPVLGA